MQALAFLHIWQKNINVGVKRMKKNRLCARAVAAMLGVLLLPASPVYAAGADWTVGNPLVAHALGEHNGKIETNSKEAFISSWENGYQVLEADFTYTSDGTLVVRHDFDAGGSYYRLEIKPQGNLVMDTQTYKNQKIVYEQTPLTAADLIALLGEYKDVYLITDTKNTDKATIQRQFTDLRTIAMNTGNAEVLNRIVPQIYNEEMLGWVKEIYNFPQWVYTLYQQTNPDYAKIADFCAANQIGVVTIEKSRARKDVTDIFHAKGIQVYAHTVNRYINFQELLAHGVDGIYTDTIKPYELSWVGLQNNRKVVQKTVTMQDKNYTWQTIDIMGTPYVRLRDFSAMMSANGGFSAIYDANTKTLALKNSGTFTTLGNELLLQQSNRYITKKAQNKLTYNDVEMKMEGYTVDGDLYYPLQGLLDMVGCKLEEKMSSNVVSFNQ